MIGSIFLHQRTVQRGKLGQKKYEHRQNSNSLGANSQPFSPSGEESAGLDGRQNVPHCRRRSNRPSQSRRMPRK